MKNQFTFLLLIFLCFEFNAQQVKEIIQAMPFRNIGPAFMSGRIADIAIDPTDKSTWYVATASSNVWKTTNRGTTWQPIFDHYGAFSTGCITIDPKLPSTIWLGTGENQSQRSVGWGDGVYKSLDGGASWKNMGLKESEHIGEIAIHPKHSNIVFVAAQGPLWRPGGDRGLYRSKDGGGKWEKVIDISENTGISDVVIDPVNPEVIYAASYQRRRHVGILVAGGPESRIFKSTDGGNTWRILEKGLPSGEVGRIGIAISPHNHQIVYALVVASEDRGGFYRSDDSGESWKKMSDHMIVDPQYYGEIYPDPHRFDCVYVIDMMTHFTEDGGKTFQRLNRQYKHVDDHAVVFDPDDPDYLMIGCDGGIYESFDRATTWSYHDNLPITQFYRVGIDNAKPFYHVYGGTQDNSTLRGPAQNTSRQGITNRDWKLILGGDGFQARVDPEDPNIIYAQYQYAGIVRYDLRTGERVDIQPQPEIGDVPLRWHWDSPLIISPHNPRTLYFAAQRLFRSNDRGDSWVPVSDDLSRNENRNNRPVMGRIWSPEAVWKNVFTSPYGTIVSLAESTVEAGLIAVGTDDGLIQITQDGGATWERFDQFANVPAKSYVADLIFSKHDKNTLYAVFNNHKEGDFEPYILTSKDLGKSWQRINSGISKPHACWTILEDHVDPKLLFAGSEFGVYCSVDMGKNWHQMKGKLPTICVRDMEIHPEENDLVLATFGRGMWILDDYSALRKLTNDVPEEGNVLFPISDAQMFIQRGDLGYSRKGVFGHNFYSGNNPPEGAVARVYLKKDYPTQKKVRKQAEKKAPNDTTPTDYQTLKAEDNESEAKVFIEFKNAEGQSVGLVHVENRKGYQQVVIPFRPKIVKAGIEEIRTGPMLPEGLYSAQLALLQNGVYQILAEPQSFSFSLLDLSPEGRDEKYYDFYAQVEEALLQAMHLSKEIDKANHQLEIIEKKSLLNGIDAQTSEAIFLARSAISVISDRLKGDETLIDRFEYYLPGIMQRLRRISGDHYDGQQVTITHKRSFEIAQQMLKQVSEEFQQLKQKIDQMDLK
jgi:photosystem II stability/assembly factor-like uncharacterized protein